MIWLCGFPLVSARKLLKKMNFVQSLLVAEVVCGCVSIDSFVKLLHSKVETGGASVRPRA